MSWVFTEDREDPCCLCVQWEAPEGMDPDLATAEDLVPYLPDGPVERVCMFVHGRCADSVAQMQAEHEAERGGRS